VEKWTTRLMRSGKALANRSDSFTNPVFRLVLCRGGLWRTFHRLWDCDPASKL